MFIYEIKSEWNELDRKWIVTNTKQQAINYLKNLNCEYTFYLKRVEGVPMDDPDFDATDYFEDL